MVSLPWPGGDVASSTLPHISILLHGVGSNGEKFGFKFPESGISSLRIKLTGVWKTLHPHELKNGTTSSRQS
jgi:hypothetical protein